MSMPVKIALIQQKAGPRIPDNIERAVRSFTSAAESGARLIAFAELAFTPFYPRTPADGSSSSLAETIPGPTTEIFRKLAARYRVVTVLNLFEKKSGRTYDASPVIDADGRLLGVTRMMHIMDAPGFHERGYYHPGGAKRYVYPTAVGRVGIAICYDRHFPEYMRGLGVGGAEIVVIPQAGTAGEWTEGLYEAEVRVAAFQNGYFAALVNRVGREKDLRFDGGSFVSDPDGAVIARAARFKETVLTAECDLERIAASAARRHFMGDRRPEAYRRLGLIPGG
jgi:beta-ureidopropionase